MPDDRAFSYAAVDSRGRRVRGQVLAESDQAAFDLVKTRGLAPFSVKATKTSNRATGVARLSDRDAAAFFSDLGALLTAGADMRLALSILGSKSAKTSLQHLTRQMSTEVAGGLALNDVFRRHLPERHQFIAALVAAGTASGDLAGSLERASEILFGRVQTRDELVSALAYPLFVLISAVVALLIIVLLVIPSLAPLAEAKGAHPGMVLKALLALSKFLRANGTIIGAGLGMLAAISTLTAVFGLWRPIIDRILLTGPSKKIAGSLTYGAFAVSLGGLLGAGAPVSDAIRLATGGMRSSYARRALERVAKLVRQGQKLSAALDDVPGFPTSIVRLVVVGEQAATLGSMLVRAGRFEEGMALRQIGRIARVVGPALIVALGALIGTMMTGLLTGISDIGAAALE